MKEYLKKVLFGICISYTAVSVSGAVVNMITGTETNNFNSLVMFGTCVIASLVLSLYEFVDKVSPLFMMVIQYLAACALCAVMLFIISRYSTITPRGWFEYFRSFTIPYVIIAGVYYYSVFAETKKKNVLIKEIQQIGNEQ